MNEIIYSENMVKSYGMGCEMRNALDHVSVNLKEGEFVSVMGPSGSGKSTLLFAVSGMDSIDSGKVVFHGMELNSLREQELADLRRKQMGFVFQQPTMLKNLNILDNILLPAISSNRKNRMEIIQKAKALMKKVGILELCERDITQVSGGQLQRAGICRALMMDPKIIFGDEPTGALNSKSADDIMDIFSQINEGGTTVMLVTHDAKVAARTERVLFMRDGKIAGEIKLPKWNEKDGSDRMKKIIAKMQSVEAGDYPVA